MKEDMKTALVTGASSGIGKAAAIRLAGDGMRVCVNHLDDDARASEVVRHIHDAGGEGFHVNADVSVEDDIKRLVGTVLDRWGRIDVLVSNAGISGAGPSFFEIGLDDWERLLRINLTSQFIVVREVLKHMVERKYGRIVTMSSVGGVSSLVRCNAHYAAAKGGIVALTRRIARDFGKDGITANCIAPGFVRDTGFNESAPADIVEAYVSQIPRGRPGYTNDIAGLVSFLVSDDADWITGQVITIDGGATC